MRAYVNRQFRGEPMNGSLNKTRRAACLFATALLLLLSAAGSGAQSAFGIITGRVLDPNGGSVPGATVAATNVETAIVRTTKTTSDGLYSFTYLQPGVYNVTVESASFNKAAAKGVKLQVGDQLDVNFSLIVAGRNQVVTVTTEVPLIETTKTDVSTIINDKD